MADKRGNSIVQPLAKVSKKQKVYKREEFRAPRGVRKSPRNDPRLSETAYGDFGLRFVLDVSRSSVGTAPARY